MKHTTKRIVSVLLVLCMVLSVLPASVFAAPDQTLKVAFRYRYAPTSGSWGGESGRSDAQTVTVDADGSFELALPTDYADVIPNASFNGRILPKLFDGWQSVAGVSVSYDAANGKVNVTGCTEELDESKTYLIDMVFNELLYSVDFGGNVIGDLHWTDKVTVPEADTTDGTHWFLGWAYNGKKYIPGGEILVSDLFAELPHGTTTLTMEPVYIDLTEKHIVLWTDGLTGEIYRVDTVADGETVEAPEVEKYCYRFTGWDADTTEAIMGNKVFRAQWQGNITEIEYFAEHCEIDAEDTATVGTTHYVSVWADEGYEPGVVSYEYGEDGFGFANLVAIDDKQAVYQFEVPAAVKIRVHATCYRVPQRYDVSFYADGVLVERFNVEEESSVIAPAIPEKAGYEGLHWVGGSAADHRAPDAPVVKAGDEIRNITADGYWDAVYEAKTYTLNWYHSEQDLPAKTTVKYGDFFIVPDYEGEVPEGKVLLGWRGKEYGQFFVEGQAAQMGVTPDSGELEFYPVFADNTEYCIVKFVVDGTIYDAQLYEQKSGQNLRLPAEPTKEGYTFVGWFDADDNEVDEETIVPLTGATYTAKFEAETHQVTLINSEHVTLGILPENGAAKTGDKVLIGAYAQAGYETFFLYASTVSGTPVALSQFGGEPYDVPDANGYIFVMPAEDVTVTVVEKATLNTARFYVDGKLYAFEHVKSGEAPEAPAQPVKEGYTFIGWRSGDKLYTPDEAFDAIYADKDYTAEFEINTYDLTYYRGEEADASEYKCILALPDGTFVEFFNNDTVNMPTYVVGDVTYGDTVVLGEPMLPGYVFKGWLDESGYVHPAGAKFTMPASNVLLTAVWEIDTGLNCMVRFVVDGQLYSAFLAFDGQDATIPAVDPEIAGKRFIGWVYGENTYSNDGVKNFVVEANDEREMTLEAAFEDILYTVTYNVDGDLTKVEDIPYNTELVTPQAPEKEGYTFVAWQDEANGAYYLANTAFTVTSDRTFTAVWMKDDVQHVVKFFDEKGNLVDLFVVKEDETVTAPVYEQGRPDAEYVWVDVENNRFLRQSDSLVVDKDYSFRATKISEAAYDVTVTVLPADAPENVATVIGTDHLLGEVVRVDVVVPEGYVLKSVSALSANGTPVVAALVHEDGANYALYFTMPSDNVNVTVELEQIPVGSTVVKFYNDGDLYDYIIVEKGTNGTAPETAPTKAGYSFVEWRSEDAFVGAGGTFAVAADAPDEIVYNAVYTQNLYKVHFNLDGGTPDYPDIHDVAYGETVVLADAAQKDGYVFIGWREDATGIVYGAGANYVVYAGADFTAIWEAAECIVRFVDPDTGILYGYEPVSEGKQVTAPEAPTVEGKTFLYWVNKENATDKVFAGALTPNILEDTTYFAVYETSRHNIAVVADNCTVSGIPTGSVDVGTAVSFTVTANERYTVASVVLTYTDGLSPVVRELHPDENGVYTFVMPDADVTVTAKAVQNVFSIFTQTDANGSIRVAQYAAANDAVEFTVTVNEGYVLSNIYARTASGKIVALAALDVENGTYLFTMPAEDVTIYAFTKKADFTVTYLDADNTLLAIVPVAYNELASAPTAQKDGYKFVGWEKLPQDGTMFDPATDKVTENLIVRAVYEGLPFTVEAGLVDHVHMLNAECTVSSGNVNSSNLLQGKLIAEAGKDVYFTVAADYDYVITGIAIVGLDGSKTIIEPTLRLKETVDGINYYTVTFPMPAENVKIDVYTAAKLFRVDVEENVDFAGDYTINGFYTNNLLVPQGDLVTINIQPIAGYEVVDVTGTFFDGISRVSLVDFTLSADKTQFTFPMVARDVLVEITYAPIEYNVDVKTSNFETYKPDTSVNPAKVVESLDPELTSKGRIELLPLQLEDYTNENDAVYKIPANGTAIVDQRICFQIVAYTGYELDYVTVTYDNGERTCPLTFKDGKYYFDMPADDVVITAVFKEKTYTVTKDAASERYGKVEMNGLRENVISVDYKDEVSVVVTPDAGYQVSRIYYVLADGSVMDFDKASYENLTVLSDALDTDHSILFHMPATDVTVYVEYAPIDYTVDDICQQATVSYTTPHHVNEQVVFTTEANEGYIITKVYVVNQFTGERVEIHTASTNAVYGATYTFTMPAAPVTIHVETIEDEFNVVYIANGNVVDYEDVPYLSTADVASRVAMVENAPAGYHFVGWTSNDVQTPVTEPSVNNDDFVVIQKTYIFAVYEKDEIHVHFLATENGIVTELSTGNTAEYTLMTTHFGDVVAFTAVPDEGYVIDVVSITTLNGDGYTLDIKPVVNGNTYTFVIPATFKADIHNVLATEVTVGVTFKKDTFTLTKASDCGTDGTIAVNGKVSTETSFNYQYQDDVTITATPDAGYYVASIVAVNADGTVKFEKIGAKPAVDTPAGDPLTLSFRMPACDLTYKVVYEKIDYSLTCVYNAEQGTVTTDPANIAQVGDIVTVTVMPKDGYKLAELTATYANGEKSLLLTKVAENTYTFTMPADAVVITALFTEVTYNVHMDVIGDADVTLNGDYTYDLTADYLDTVTIDVVPDAGWKLVSIVVNGGAVAVNEEIKPEGGKYTFTMPHEDANIVVTLEKTSLDMTAHALNFYEEGHGTVTLNPEKVAYVGDRIIITADPDDGYRVKEVVVEDKYGYAVPVSFISGTPGYVETWSFTMPAYDVNIKVYFEVQGASYYDDVRTDHWFYNAVTFVTDRGYFLGITDELFGPYINMNRAMFVTVLGRISRVDTSKYTTQAFKDVELGTYYAPYVAWAAENGIVLGRSADVFDPSANITREEMAAIMYRYCEFLGEDMTLKNQVFMDRYEDAGKISTWARPYVEWAVGVGLIRGMSDTTIDPLSYASRAQVAQVIMNLCDKVLYE